MSTTVKLSIDDGHTHEAIYRFDEPAEFVIGRAEDCEIGVPDTPDYREISQHHCRFRIDPPRIWVSALESKNGTFVNDLKISSMVGQFRLYDDDQVQLGPVRMSVHIVEQDSANPLEKEWVSKLEAIRRS